MDDDTVVLDIKILSGTRRAILLEGANVPPPIDPARGRGRSATGDGASKKRGIMNTGNPAYAHTLPGQLRSEWELLDDHARKVASLTRTFAAAFGAAQWGEQLGHWHDLGKWSDAFQAYISPSEDPNAAENEHSPGRVDHSTFGARHAARSLPGMAGQLLAFCIAGHHAGLPDATTTEAERTDQHSRTG